MKRSLRGLYVIRGGAVSPSVTQRAKKAEQDDTPAPDDGRLATLEVNFSPFNTWYRIDSWLEGTFMERSVPGAFKKTFAERGAQTKILFNHGQDLNIGDKVLAVPESYGERKDSPFIEGGLLDTSYNRDLLPGLRSGAYGSSFMFEVLHDEWNEEPERSEDNPDGIPERTIHEVRLFEAGPVTWPANPDATAGVRSGADWFAERIRSRDADRYTDLVRSFSAFRALNGLHVPSGTPQPQPEKAPESPAPQGRHATDQAARKRYASLLSME